MTAIKLLCLLLFFLLALDINSQPPPPPPPPPVTKVLIFSYDLSGNQKQRFYCSDASCQIPSPPSGKFVNEEKIAEEIDNKVDHQLKIYPNPTKDIVYIKIESSLYSQIESINIYNSNSSLIKNLNKNNNNPDLEINLTGMPTGIYFLHIHLKGANSITKKIIKE
jgi:Secretion system C-terminal sorting domain